MSEVAMKPLTPPDCDLRDFSFMPLDVVRLRDSDMALTQTPEACWAAVLLWCASWHQIPAASLPDDDRILSNLAGYGRVVKEWAKVKTGAMHGWVKCDDGRLYHKVVAEKAVEAWDSKLRQRWMTECARIKKHAERHKIELRAPSFDEWKTAGRHAGGDLLTTIQATAPKPAADIDEKAGNRPDVVPGDNTSCRSNCPDGVPSDNASKGQGQGQGYINTPLTPQGEAPDGAGGVEPVFPSLVEQEEFAADEPVAPIDSPAPSADSADTARSVCLALKAIGISSTNSGDRNLLALIDAGADLQEFVGAAQQAVASGNGRFKYVLGIVTGERRRAAELAAQLHTGAMPAKVDRPTFAQAQADIARSTVPGRTGRDPALARIEADAAKASPMPADVRAKLNALRGAA